VLKLRARSKIKKLISDEAGTVALDYGMIASFLAVALITGLSPVGNNLGTSFRTAADAILAAPSPTPPPPAAAPPTAAPAAVAPKVKQ
jgi:Flp pilus assembly pilin Flp